MWELLLAGEDVRKAFRRGVYGIWSQSAEVGPQQGLARLMAERPNRSLGRDQPETLSSSRKVKSGYSATSFSSQSVFEVWGSLRQQGPETHQRLVVRMRLAGACRAESDNHSMIHCA